MSPHHRADQYLDELIREKFSVSLMSNSKWVKLITALVENWAVIQECLVKPIWDDEPPFRQLLIDENTVYDFDYYDSAMEGMISDKPRGWYAYREIEWLDFPRQIKDAEKNSLVTQNLELIAEIINSTGQYFTELTQDNLRLYAYLKQAQSSGTIAP